MASNHNIQKQTKPQGKVAIARLTMRNGNAPSLVALWPQVELVDEGGAQVAPPGLHVLPLPWRDELRFPERGASRTAAVRAAAGRAPATGAQVEAAAALVGAMRLGEDFAGVLEALENPSLSRHFEVVEVSFLVFFFCRVVLSVDVDRSIDGGGNTQHTDKTPTQ